MTSRRQFIQSLLIAPCFANIFLFQKDKIYTVTGEIGAAKMGQTLIHEHVLVDFIGADKISSDRWKHEEVLEKVLPFLLETRDRGYKTLLECTPAFLGRDVILLQKLSKASGIQILTNTGFYGASDNKFLPPEAFTDTAEQLAEKWIKEFHNGIDGTNVKPGFIKIGVNPGPLSALHQNLVMAAAITHLQTGLTICSHTGPPLPAFEEVEILLKAGVHPSAFVWVHANGSLEDILKIAKSGAWISLDGIGDESLEKNAETILQFKSAKLLDKILISHDAGWYQPGEPGGGKFRGFTTIHDKFLPMLRIKGFTESEIDQLLVKNPAEAFVILVRKK